MAEWDLVPTLAKYLDPQFVFGLIQFISTKDVSFHWNFVFYSTCFTFCSDL